MAEFVRLGPARRLVARVGAVVALLFRIRTSTIGLIMGFGAGVLISAVAFDLVEEAMGIDLGRRLDHLRAARGLRRLLRRRLADRPHRAAATARTRAARRPTARALAIVLGTVLDGIPESMVIGLTIYEGGAVGAAYLAAVFISNLPESISSTAGLVGERLGDGRGSSGCGRRSRVVSGLASLAGYGLFQEASGDVVAFVLSFAAGAILTMLADTMMPEAYEDGGKLVGVVTVLGFCVALTIHELS